MNTQGALFILTTETTFPALYGALSIFPTEWPVFMRESRNGLYSPTAYYLSKVLALVTIITIIFPIRKRNIALVDCRSLSSQNSEVIFVLTIQFSFYLHLILTIILNFLVKYYPILVYLYSEIRLWLQIPGYVIETFIFVTIAYWLMGLRPEAGAFFKTCLVLIVTCNTAAACGNSFDSIIINIDN